MAEEENVSGGGTMIMYQPSQNAKDTTDKFGPFKCRDSPRLLIRLHFQLDNNTTLLSLVDLLGYTSY